MRQKALWSQQEIAKREKKVFEEGDSVTVFDSWWHCIRSKAFIPKIFYAYFNTNKKCPFWSNSIVQITTGIKKLLCLHSNSLCHIIIFEYFEYRTLN